MIDANGNTTTYGYDQVGNLISIWDANGNQTTFTYNEVNQLIKTTNPLSQEKSFYYCLRDNLMRTIDPKGQIINFSYDDVNQLISKITPDNTYTYQYDNVGNLISLVDNDSNLSFTYDLANRLTKAQTNATIAQPATTISYSYDKNSNRLTMTNPQGGATNYTYDALNRLTSLTSPQGQTKYTYDKLSRRINLALPNGITTSYTYDLATQLLQITNNQLPITNYQYTYDDVGNRLSMTDSDGPHNYIYDNLNRLTQATHPTYTKSFNYDPVGNREGATYDQANRLLEDNEFTYTYDANGNLTTKTEKSTSETTTYQYDAENQLISVVRDQGSVASYRYDGLGRRIEKDVNGTITRYIYDNEDILSELNAQGSVLASYTHGPGIDEPISMNRASQTSYYHADGLGSIRQLSGSTGQLVKSYSYDSFGNLSTTDYGLPTVINPYTFTGREYDPESGLYYYRARYYDPHLGRFLQEDPISQSVPLPSYTPQISHPYIYAQNNPINYTDSTGLLVQVCTRPVKPPLKYIRAVHCYIKIGTETWGFYNDSKVWTPDIDPGKSPKCYPVVIKEDGNGKACADFEKCVRDEVNKPPRRGYHRTDYNCCDWVRGVLANCGADGLSWINYGF